jgi:hypothetical protein
MSPEQFIGKGVDHRTDIYSCGVLLYQFLTGERPFTGSVITIMHKAVNQEAIPPSQLNRDVSPELDAVVNKAMAKLPENRYQTAAEFMQALKVAGQTIRPTHVAPLDQPTLPLIGVDDMFDITDKTIVFPGSGKPSNKREPIGWQPVLDSNDPADFERYLAEHPLGELAKPLELSPQQQRPSSQEQAADAGQRPNSAVQPERRHAEAAMREQLARKIAELRNEATKSKALELAQQKKAVEERAQRAGVLAAVQFDRAGKFAAEVSAREAEREVEQQMEAEAKRKLAEEAQRKKSLKGARLRHKAVPQAATIAENGLHPEASQTAMPAIPAARIDTQAAAVANHSVEAGSIKPMQRGKNKRLIVGAVFLLVVMALALSV